MAEITQQDDFGVAMGKCINRYAIRKILEIGAFDGDESTQVLAKALAEKKGEKSLVSLEEKSERFKNLVANTRVYPFVRAVQASSLGCDFFSARDFEKDVWSSPFHGLRYSKEQVAGWHAEDMVRIQQLSRGFLEDSTEDWDAVLIDGGEFVGRDEFRLLRSRSRCFFLDGAFHAFKKWNNRHIFLMDTACELVKKNLRLRNWYSIFSLRLPCFWGWV